MNEGSQLGELEIVEVSEVHRGALEQFFASRGWDDEPFRGIRPAPDVLLDALRQDSAAEWIAADRAGLVCAYLAIVEADFRNGVARLRVALTESCSPAQASVTFEEVLGRASRRFPLRKLYYEELILRQPALLPLANWSVTCDGRFRRHRFYGGELVDVVLLCFEPLRKVARIDQARSGGA